MSVAHVPAVDVIAAKRDRRPLDPATIDTFLGDYLAGHVGEEQMAALLMAIYLNGMTDDETFAWTRACTNSGRRLDWSHLPRPTVDKHSTGGVGDKVTLVLTPLLAALGAAVPQISGRGLGHTGGTLDKLDAIPGWQSTLDAATIERNLRDVGAVVVAASDDLAPADKRLYALRDVTGTVASIPLIAASIMSKKIASGTSSLVLDVKVGSGAFMATAGPARELAELMVRIGAAEGVPTRAVLTAMDTPIGWTAGNAVEVAEAVDTLTGNGPADLVELVVRLAGHMCELAGLPVDPHTAPAAALADGSAYETWRRMLAAQGADPDAALPVAAHRHTVTADRTGWLTRLDARKVGNCAWHLGAGRNRAADPVDPVAGVRWYARPGDPVSAGEPLFDLYTSNPATFPAAIAALADATTIADERPDPAPPILDTITLDTITLDTITLDTITLDMIR